MGNAANIRQPTNMICTVIALVGLVLSGCGGYDPDSLGAQALRDLSPLEVEVLRDKVVTEQERNDAATALQSCLTRAGAENIQVDDEFGVSYEFAGGEAELSAFDTLTDECDAETDAIGAVWFMQIDDSLFETPLPGLEEALERLDVDNS